MARRIALLAVFIPKYLSLLCELLLSVLLMLTPVMFFVDIVSDLSDITLRLGGLPRFFFSVSIVVSPFFISA